MLQFIAQPNERYTIPEMVQMAIEGGCKWVVLRVPDMPDEQVRELASELVPLCRETSTILTIENRMELAKELALHGVYLTPEAGISAMDAREACGPEAIIGVEVGIASDVLALKGADIDYAAFPATMPLERVGENIEALRDAHNELPIVANGEFDEKAIALAKVLGINGIAVSREIVDADDPVVRTEELISALEE